MTAAYTPDYYARLSEGSRASAAAVVPLVIELIQPASVIDVGCGTGAWLAAFQRQGVADVCGVDGPHVDRAQLEIEPRQFFAADLALPLSVGRQFDLALSLEVAEHLPESLADQFIETLTTLAPVMLFSAAVPDQGGEHHVNEQWPEYWVELFATRGFAALDPFRRLLWQRSDVDWWYAQNMLLFVHPGNYQQHTWQNRVLHLAVDLATVVPTSERLLLVDEDRFGPLYLPGRHVLPFLERDGLYAGPPRDDEQAIAELRRMQQLGATFIAFGWPAFWWLSHYREFAAHLDQHHSLVLRNDRVVLFRLQRSER
jgi:SAM-dependent methyltransferase